MRLSHMLNVDSIEVSRFEDAVKSTDNEGKLVVKDIIELVVESMGPEE